MRPLRRIAVILGVGELVLTGVAHNAIGVRRDQEDGGVKKSEEDTEQPLEGEEEEFPDHLKVPEATVSPIHSGNQAESELQC